MRRKKNIIRTMNRLTVVRSSVGVGGGVAHSKAGKIPWQKRIQQMGGNWFANPFHIKQAVKGLREKKTRKQLRAEKKQKGAGWFDSFSQGMFGTKMPTRGRGKRKPAVIHSAGRGKSQDNYVAKKQKGGLLWLEDMEKWQKGRSKKQQNTDAAWMRKNL